MPCGQRPMAHGRDRRIYRGGRALSSARTRMYSERLDLETTPVPVVRADL
jgi:hypothetical protein